MSTINLLPEDYLERRIQRRANTICVILFLVVMGGVGTAALVSEQTMNHTREVLNRVNASYADAAKLLTQMKQLEATKRQMMAKAKATASLLERVPRSYLLAMVVKALPEGTSLTQVELAPGRARRVRESRGSKFKAAKNKSQGKPPPNKQMPPMVLKVTGLAATDMQVGSFIANLKNHPLLSSVDISYTQDKVLNERERDPDKPKIRVREFKVTMELRPDVDVIDLLEERQAAETADATQAQADPGAES